MYRIDSKNYFMRCLFDGNVFLNEFSQRAKEKRVDAGTDCRSVKHFISSDQQVGDGGVLARHIHAVCHLRKNKKILAVVYKCGII